MRTRFAIGSLASFLLLAACDTDATDDAGQVDNAIVDIPQTPVESQTISNCWLYAHGAWAESLYLSATGRTLDISQSYWTYWHWFTQITSGGSGSIDTEGSWDTANKIIGRFGVMQEANFIGADAHGESSPRQAEALAALNASLATGKLKTAAARRDRRLVRAELDEAWRLSGETRAMLDRVFGPGVERSFEAGATDTGPVIHRADELPAAYARAPNQPKTTTTLARAMTEWKKSRYEGSTRPFQIRVQRALHDGVPIYMTWLVDFNALESGNNARHGAFNMETLRARGPGRQGIHMSIIEDYQATLADGTLLPARETLDRGDGADRNLLERALESGTRVSFFRIKNSWGTRGTTAFVPRMPGYNDLYLDYLDGPVAGRRPWISVMLPPGY